MSDENRKYREKLRENERRAAAGRKNAMALKDKQIESLSARVIELVGEARQRNARISTLEQDNKRLIGLVKKQENHLKRIWNWYATNLR